MKRQRERGLWLYMAFVICGLTGDALHAQTQGEPVVRIAELVIDPSRLDAYKAAVKEEMQAAVQSESGVLAIYAVAEKGHPATLHFFEIYASDAAYHAHIQSPHFRKYVSTTQPMIRSRKLIETLPIQLSAKTVCAFSSEGPKP